MKIYAIIPARSGSKGLPNKNISPILGKPLLSYSISFAKNIPSINRVFCSTDSSEYAEIAVKSIDLYESFDGAISTEGNPVLP